MKKVAFIALGFLTITACEGTREQLGLEQQSPDEFAVVKRAPLEMPPDYYLRPPSPGAQRPQELSTDQQAKQSVFGTEAVEAQAEERIISGGESILLNRTNAANVDPNIRAKVDAEAAENIEEGRSITNRIRRAVGQPPLNDASVVDPTAETERLRENEEQGLPVNEGEVPTIER
ncbi:MAG: DUF3035 domain-containing protein [Pseudomonadota bacterium]